jgi:K+-transporting ATPase ATPase C chain
MLFTLWTMVLFGVLYPLLVWGVGWTFFRAEADGSLVLNGDGTIMGSRLVGQGFAADAYFHPRPSGVSYDAASTGGTNNGPTNPAHLQAVEERAHGVASRERVAISSIPSDLVTASGSGVDPHISPEAAELQLGRVARARGVSEARILEILEAHREEPLFGFLGRPRVNVFELNVDLDRSVDAELGAIDPEE